MTTGLLTTTAGQAAIAADLTGGADLVLSHVAFGDSNGVPYVPNEAQVSLVNERYRSTIASVAVVAGAIVVDAVLPADTPDGSARPSHGFNIAEAGLYSAAGTLIGVARMGNGFKPSPSSGQAQIATFRFKLAVANPSAISVVIDPQAQIALGRHVRTPWLTVDGLLNAPPANPNQGDTYIVGPAPTGAWTGLSHRIAQWIGVWALASAPIGHLVTDNSKADGDSLRYLRRTATGWISGSASTAAQGPTRLATIAETRARLLSDVAITPAALVAFPLIPDGPVTLFVRTDGNDANDGSANDAAHAFATIAAAVNFALTRFWIGSQAIEIVLGTPGAYSRFEVASGNFVVRGKTADPASYVISGAPGSNLLVPVSGGALRLKDLALLRLDGGNHVVTAVSGGSLVLDNVASQINTGGPNSVFTHIAAGTGGTIAIAGPVAVQSSAGSVLSSTAGSIQVFGKITVPGGGAFTDNTVKAAVGGTINFGAGSSWIVDGGGSPVAQRFSAASNGVINTSGAGPNFIPGTAAGVEVDGGRYV